MLQKPTVVEVPEHGDLLTALKMQGFKPPEYRSQPEKASPDTVWVFGLGLQGATSYYIGIDWLDATREVAIRSKPKIPSLDFMEMFRTCLLSPVASRELGVAYTVKTDVPFIPMEDESFDFTPLLMHHFLAVLARLLRRPMHKGYVAREENLKAKVKGKILMGEQIRRNVCSMRPDRVACAFQEFSVDCPDNRLLHSAYDISLRYLRSLEMQTKKGHIRIETYEPLVVYFHGIGRIEHLREIYAIRSNPLYRDYSEALRLAKMIYRFQGYKDIHAEAGVSLIPPYVIDMAKLFELYVYHCLKVIACRKIEYQVSGNRQYADFVDLDEQLVIDAKYKPQYTDFFTIEDIRQVSGYARDLIIRRRLGVDAQDFEIPCLIIYPEAKGWVPSQIPMTGKHLQYQPRWTPSPHSNKLYKMGIALPLLDGEMSSPCRTET